MPDSWNIFMSSVNVTAVLICPAVNGVSCFVYILIIAFAAFDQIYDVTSLARCALL